MIQPREGFFCYVTRLPNSISSSDEAFVSQDALTRHEKQNSHNGRERRRHLQMEIHGIRCQLLADHNHREEPQYHDEDIDHAKLRLQRTTLIEENSDDTQGG